MHEAAFTLIEMLIAFTLIAIAVAVASGTMMRGFSGSSDTATLVQGKAKAMEASERLGSDVRGARSLGRDGAQIVDIIDLKRAVQSNGVLRDVNGAVLDWRDITAATADRITFQSDVVDEASGTTSLPECVTWEIVGRSPWHLQRTVRAYANGCAGGGGGVRETDRMTAPTSVLPRPGTGGTPPLFGYSIARQVGVTGCTTTTTYGTPSPAQRNHVVAVLIDFSALVEHRGEASRAALRNEFAIRSRGANDYQYAMGCTR